MSGSPYVIEVSESTFENDVIGRSATAPVVVDFWAPWCGPCRTLGPLLERLVGEAKGAFTLAKLNVDENQRLAMRFGVQGIPAVKAFRNGQVVSEFVGAQPETAVREFLRKLAPSGDDVAIAEASRMLAAHRWVDAEAALHRADPRRAAIAAALVKSLLGQGKGTEADSLLAAFPNGPEAGAVEALRPLARFLIAPATSGNGSSKEDLDAALRQASQAMSTGDFRAGLDLLLSVLRRDRHYRADEPRKVMLSVFELMGDQDALTREYRAKLASVLF